MTQLILLIENMSAPKNSFISDGGWEKRVETVNNAALKAVLHIHDAWLRGANVARNTHSEHAEDGFTHYFLVIWRPGLIRLTVS